MMLDTGRARTSACHKLMYLAEVQCVKCNLSSVTASASVKASDREDCTIAKR